MGKATIESLTEYIYDVLECNEVQTKSIINKFIGDIKLFDKKQHDYGPGNIAKFRDYGIVVRTSDKLERLVNLYKNNRTPENESIEDTWQDLSVYGAIARAVLHDQWYT